MGKIGFKSVAQKQELRKADSLEELGRVLQEVEQQSYQLEQDLKAEIWSVEHLNNNIKILEGQVAETEKYLQKRRSLVLDLLAIESSADFDTALAKNLLNRIDYLDQIINKKAALVYSEIRKYILTEAAQILTENFKSRHEINAIDELARKLLASITVINTELNAHSDSLKRIAQLIKVRENQPAGRAKRGIGF